MRASLFTAVVSDATDVVKVPKLVFVVSSDACGAFVFTVAVRVLKSVVSTFKAKAVFASEIFNFSVKVVFVVFNAERSAFAESAVSTSLWFAFCVSVVLVD